MPVVRFIQQTRICSKPDGAVLKTQLKRATDELLECLVNAFIDDDRKSGVLHFTVLHRFIKTHQRTSSVKATPLLRTVDRIAFRHLACVDEWNHCTARVYSKQVSNVIRRKTASLLQNHPCIITIGVGPTLLRAPQKCPFSCGVSGTSSSIDPHEIAPNLLTIGSSVSAQSTLPSHRSRYP